MRLRHSTKLDYCEKCRAWHHPRFKCISGSEQWKARMDRNQEIREKRIKDDSSLLTAAVIRHRRIDEIRTRRKKGKRK
jgi:hypothetical protein